MEHVLWILLVIALGAVVLVLFTGVTVFVRGGETNRRHGNRLMNLRVATQGVAVLLLGLILLVHWLKPTGH